MDKKEIVYLEIQSWAGVSLGAQHFYGELKTRGSVWEHPSIRLTRILTPRQAAKANRYRTPDHWMNVAVGDESEGFDSKEEIRKLAVKTWQTHFPEGKLLIEGRTSVNDPQLILAWPGHDEQMAQANKLFEEFEFFEGYQYRRNWPEAERLQKEWDDLLGMEWE